MKLQPDWLHAPQVQRVLGLFKAANVPICFVGGAARDAVLGAWPFDFDMAVGSEVSMTENILVSADITFERIESRHFVRRTQVDGLQFDFVHINAVTPNTPFNEALSAYAMGADFTINGMYLLPSGELCDDIGGRDDLLAGRVRFVEEPVAKIKSQPYLPLPLRYFRFYAWFGKGAPDQPSFDAAVALASKMRDIERRYLIKREMCKLLTAPSPYQALALMHQHHVLEHAVGFTLIDNATLEALERIEKRLGQRSPWQVRLLTLLLSAELPPEHAFAILAEYWQMEENIGKKLAELLDHCAVIEPPFATPEKETLLGQFGAHALKDMLVLSWALEEDVDAAAERYEAALAEI